MAENKVRGARFTPEIQEKIEAYESVFGWDFGQTVTQLFNYRERIQSVLRGLEVARATDGSVHLLHADDPCLPGTPCLNEKEVCIWLVQELQKSIAEGFRESMFSAQYDEENN